MELSPVDLRDAGEIERALTAFGRAEWRPDRDGNAAAIGHRNLIAALAARYRLPAVYPSRFYANDGGLVAYGHTPSTSFGVLPATLTASSRATSRPICRCRRRLSMSW